MHRFYADPVQSSEYTMILDAGDSHHASRVLRLQPGDTAEVFYQGRRFLAAFTFVSAERSELKPLDLLPSTEPRLRVALFQGIPKGDKMDWIVQKAVELGVYTVIPVILSRCIVRPDEKESIRKQDRWQKIAREAGKQSGRCIIPDIHKPVTVGELPELFGEYDQIVIPWEESVGYGPLSFRQRHPDLSSVGILIGPEGGISTQEMDTFVQHGCESITLGKRILRTETAGLAVISVFMGLFGEME